MAHEWHAGVLSQSSWHGLESVEAIPDARAMIARGEETGAWPTDVKLESMTTASGLVVPGSAVVAEYDSGARVAHAAVGDRYTPLDPKEWRATVEAAVAAGARPAGAFALRGGSRILATFEIPGGNDGTGLRNYLNLVDSLDGSLVHLAGGSTIRVVCANTLAMAMGGRTNADASRQGFASIRHTSSINDRAAILRTAIEAHVKEGETVRDLYKAAKDAALSRPDAEAVFAALFPEPTAEEQKEKPATATRLTNARNAAARAMKRGENYEGSSLATIWNAATWLVDRDENGKAKPARGGADKLDSLLFGTRGKRVQEIRRVVEVVLRDGTTALMEVDEARTHGVDDDQIARAASPAEGSGPRTLLDEMLGD